MDDFQMQPSSREGRFVCPICGGEKMKYTAVFYCTHCAPNHRTYEARCMACFMRELEDAAGKNREGRD